MTRPVVVIDIVGLTPALLAHMPRVAAVGRDGFRAELGTILPAVTCSVQSTFLTGTLPREHGIVGNGWLFRELSEIWLWRQSNRLVAGEKIWEAARRTLGRPITCANLFWWYAMGSTADIAVTPRPVYYADGTQGPGHLRPSRRDRRRPRQAPRRVPAVRLLGPARRPARVGVDRRRRADGCSTATGLT